MDCHQRVQNGHRVLYADRCRGSGHSLMSLMVFAFMAMVLVLPVSGNSEPCHNTQEVSDEWRDLSSSQNSKTDNCDENKFQPNTWYSFNLRGKAAWIPTQCVKSNMCGASVGMRVDLLGQSLPSVGENITAALCGAYDVLGKYDCCVLRTEVYISRCHDQRLVYRFPNPIDRCPVAVCTQGEPIIPPGIFVKTGDDVNQTGDSTKTDIPETTSEENDSTTAESTTVFEPASDDTTVVEPASDDTTVVEPASDDTTVVEESTETPQPPQPFMQTTTESETTTADVDQELSTAEATPEAASSTPSTDDASSNAAVDDTEATTTDAAQASESVTGSDTESDTSTPIIRDMFTLTSSPTPEETTELTATPYDHTSTEADSTDAALPVDDVSKETTSDNIQDASSAADLQSSTDMSTSEQPTTELQPTTQGMAIEELSSTSQTPHDTDGSDGSDDEATYSTSHDVSRTTSAESSTTESHEPVSKSATEEEDSSISTSGITSTTIIEETATPTTTESSLETTVSTRKSTKLIKPMPPSGTTTQEMEVATRSGSGDVEMNEKMRFVFIGKPQDVAPVAEVHALLDKFLLRVKADSKWTYTVVSESEAMNYENRSTYMDFRIVRLGNDLKDGATFFKENEFRKFVSDNTNMILIDQCRASKNCQEDFDHPTVLASVFEQNAPAFTAVIVLCAICLLILILVVLYTRFSKRGSWRAPEPDPNAQPENRREYNGTNSPFTDEQIVKDEMLDNASASLNGSAKDGDTNLSGTWVIPLDQEASNPHTSVSITTEDTKF
ncbi:hypothetical protein BsWGS_11516 [Bradybaena similaris]